MTRHTELEAHHTSVLTVGEALVDVVVPADGGPAGAHVGGSPANVAVGLAALDHDSRLTAHIADDEHGAQIREHLLDADVVLTPGSTTATRTPTATAHLDQAGAATYDFDLEWQLGPQDLHGIGHLHTGSVAATLEPGASAVLDLMSAARASATVSYDPNCRPSLMGEPHDVRSRIEECIGRSDVVKASEDDVRWLYGEASLEEVARLWGQLGAELVVVTRGADGALVHLPAQGMSTDLPPVPATVVDTVGAGDSFMAGLLSGLLDAGLLGSAQARARLRAADLDDVGEALRRAAACASWTVARAGASAPTRADLGTPDRPEHPRERRHPAHVSPGPHLTEGPPLSTPNPGGDAFADLLEANARYARDHDLDGFDGIARAGVAIVTCMDSRIEPLQMVGLTHGDAKIFRNPGGRVTDAALEALVLGVHLLGVRRVLIIPHTRCAMTRFSENELRARISEASGQDAWWQHFHVVPDQHAALVEDVHRVTSHPLIAGRVDVGGFLYDVDSGRLTRLV